MTRLQPMAALAASTLLLLGACGGGSDRSDASDPATTAAPTSTAPTAPATTAPSTTPAPSPSTTAPTTAAPAGKLISYANGEDTGVTIATAADTGKLTGAPADFKAFIASELANATADEGCTEKPQISVDTIDTGGWARGGHFVPQCGGYATLWAKTGGVWRDVWGGQSLTPCSTLTKYRIPARVAGDSCLDGDDSVPYKG